MPMEAKDSEERGRAIVQTLALVVESMVQPSESVQAPYVPRTKFEAFRAPGISVRDYLMRIHKYASCSPECFVLALVYIDRLHQASGLILTDLNVHRVLITSVVLAAKFFDDHYFNNAYYAKVGGVPCGEMNELEVEFLLLVNFSLHVTTDTYERYYTELANHFLANCVPGASIRFRQFVAMDPKQDGQLIYVEENTVEASPRLPDEEEQYEQQLHQQQHYEPPQPQSHYEQHQPQLHAENGYGYQQPAMTDAYEEPTVTHPYQQPVVTHQYEQPAVVANPYVAHYPVHQPQHVQPPLYHYQQPPLPSHAYNPYTHPSAIDHGGETHYTATATAMSTMHVKHSHSTASASSATSGIVYANNGRKRRQSVALGVNA